MRIPLNGEVISDEWAKIYRHFGFTTGFYCPGDVRTAVADLPSGEELTLEVNSIGGDCDAAAEIYSVIQACPSPTRAEIQSLAASAASYMVQSCDHVAIAAPAQMMIHCASWDVGGNKHDHQWAARQLDKQDVSILDTYCLHAGAKADRERLQQLMEEESFLTASECLELGLVDSILGTTPEEDPEETPLRMVAAACGNVVRAMRTLPDIRELKARRDSQLADMDRQLELEQARYL